jgi:enamidase
MTAIRLLRKRFGWFLFIAMLGPAIFAQTKRVRPVTGHIVFSARLLINPASGQVIQNAVIEVNNGRIMRVGKKGAFPVPKDAETIDFGDRVIIPGLIDTHGHLFGGLTVRHKTCDMLAAFFLAAGVTTVRSPGSMEPEGDIGLQNRINSGRLLGPRYFNSGPYVEGDPVSVVWMHPVNTPEEVRLKIDQWIKQGASSVKIYAALAGDLLRTAIAHGHAHGVKVIGHIGAATYVDAIRMGIDELFHGILAMPDSPARHEPARIQTDNPTGI